MKMPVCLDCLNIIKDDPCPHCFPKTAVSVCRLCGDMFNTDDPLEDWCGKCPILKHHEPQEQRLKLFKANLEAEEDMDAPGFYMLVLAENLDQALVFIQSQFNAEYEGVFTDIIKDNVVITELDGPFNAGTILTSIHY